jgi:hypothetical protein
VNVLGYSPSHAERVGVTGEIVSPMNLVSGILVPMSRSDWTFLSNHGHILLAVGQDPTARVRDLADRVGITERSAQQILNDLVDAGYVRRTRTGRRNTYALSGGMPFRHPLEAGQSVDRLLAMFGGVPATR